jgi:hypothetical protein
MSAKDVERVLEGKNGPNVVCTKGTDGWDYTCKTIRRKIGVDVHDNGTAELSNWTPIGEPLVFGPAGESADVRARFVDEAVAVCTEAATMIGRLPPPVSRRDALSRMDQILDLRQELIGLQAIKPPTALVPEYTVMVGAMTQVVNDEMQLRDGIATRAASTRESALAGRRRDARQANETALRLRLVGCSNAAIPLPGITR